MTDKTQVEIRKKALDLLARREHTEQQMRRKLNSHGHADEDIESVVHALINDRLLSDERFTEAFVRSRFSAGVGPCKIRYELLQRGVADDLIDEFLESFDGQWHASMVQQRVRKYGILIPDDYKERMKQARFLQNRGFSAESVMRLFR